MNCNICDIANNDASSLTVLQNPKWSVTLDPNQQNIGKCWVTLLAHKEKLSELDDSDWSEFIKIVKILETNTSKAFSPHHYNWQCLMNDSGLNGSSPHIHWHFTPRYEKPINFNGDTFIDENYPKTNKNERKTANPTLIAITNRLKS